MDSSVVGYDGARNVKDEEHSLEAQEDHKGKREPWTVRKFGGKEVWEWLNLLIVPIMLSLLTVVFTWQQDARQQRIENQRAEAEQELAEQQAQDEALQAYLTQMSTLMLEKNLRNSGSSEEDTEVRTLARARTLTVLGRLDSEHNRAILQFLQEALLIGGTDPVISLNRANLRGAKLSGADLTLADLSDADLSHADLSEAELWRANLNYANLTHADLSQANLDLTDLRSANLSRANLSEAYLIADLSYADLSGARGVTNDELAKNLASAGFLHGTTMPNGQKYEDWLKSKDQEQNKKSGGSS